MTTRSKLHNALFTRIPGKLLGGLAIVASCSFLFACTEDSDPELEREKFTSVFDHSNYSAAFYPIDIRQTADGNYLILAEQKIPDSNFRGIYLLMADAAGNFVRDMSLNSHANPVGDLMNIQNEFSFLALDTITLQATLVKVDAQLGSATTTSVSGVGFPSAASVDGAGFVALGYNHADKASVISRHDASGSIIKGPLAFGIGAGDEVEEPIMKHILRTGKQFPFQVGKASNGLYFFNGFENYSFSLVFTDIDNEGPLGVIHGQQDDGGLSAVVPLGNGKFAASRFEFGQNYFLPGVTLQTGGSAISSDLGGFVLPELVPDASVEIMQTTIGSKSMLIYASDTRSKQIGLFFYDEATGKFVSSRYLGFSNPFEVAAIIRTSDEGLAICGTTWLAGRFPRICLFKISKEDLEHQAS